jgi:predicted Zn-dependent peptidase
MNTPISKHRLKNGLSVLYRHTPKSLMAEFQLILPGAQTREPARRGGLSHLTMEVAVKGTARRSYAQLSEEIESLGASIWGDDSPDYGSLNLSVPAEQSRDALPYFAETILEASYPPSELEKERKATLAEIKSKEEHPFTIAYERLKTLLFDHHPYGRPEMGESKTVSSITREDILRWRKAWLQPRQAILSAASPIPFDRALKQIEKLLGHPWPHRGRFSANPSHPPHPRRETKITLKRKFKQTYLLFGFEAPCLSDPLYPAIKVLDALLGGGMSARLFQEIREKHGLAYEVGSFYPTRMLGSGFVIHMGLRASKAKQAEQCIRDLLKNIATHTPSSEEVEEAKQYIRGTYFMDHQTNSRKAFYAGWWEVLGKGATYDARYPRDIAAVTPDDVRTAAQTLFSKPAQIVELHPH